MGSPVLGIDLGTTNSVVAVFDGSAPRVLLDASGSRLTPSVVSFHPSGRVLVGHEGRERRLLDAGNTVFSTKRLIGRPYRSPEVRRAADRLPFALREAASGGVVVEARGETYSLPEIGALVLRQVRAVAEADLGQACVNAVVTVPANFNELQRTATRDAGRIAGLNVLRILNEPTAAALAYGYTAREDQRIAVYDLGGGTFDVSVLDLAGDVIEVIATAGDSYLGGDDIDSAVADRMAQEFLRRHNVDLGGDMHAYERLRLAAEWLKCQLSSAPRATCRVEEVAYGKHGSAMDLEFTLSRDELDKITFPIIGRTFDICEDALRIAGVRQSQLDNVILVGGQTASPLVRQMVTDYFGRAPLASVDPSEVVAQGAAILGHTITGGAFVRRKPTSTRPEPLREAVEAAFEDEPTRVADRSERGSGDDAQETTHVAARIGLPPGAEPKTNTGTLLGMGERRPKASAPPPVPEDARKTASGRRRRRPNAPPVSRPSPPVRGEPVGRVTLKSASSAPPPPLSAPPPMGEAERRAEEALKAPLLPMEVRPPEARAPVQGAAQQPPPPGLPPADVVLGGSFGPMDELPSASASDIPISEPPEPSDTSPERPSRRSPSPPAVPVQSEPAQPDADAALGADAARAVMEAVPDAPAAPRQGVRPSQRGVPILLDVTPHTLAVETTGGFCEQIIERNAPIPTEQTRRFSTSQDNQVTVRVRVCQGEERRVEQNQELGAVELMGLRRAARGVVKIDVTFMIDSDGTLAVKAQDRATGKEQQIRIDLVGALSDADVERMRERQNALGWE